MDLSPLLSTQFWFSMTPVRMSPLFESALFALMALFVVAGAVLRIVAKNEEKSKYRKMTFKRLAGIFIGFGLVGLLWWFFSFEEIQLFGMRMWFLVWLVVLIIVLLRLVLFVRKEIPAMQHREQSRVDANKYLPRRN